MPLAHNLSIYLDFKLSGARAGLSPVPTSGLLVWLEFSSTTAIWRQRFYDLQLAGRALLGTYRCPSITTFSSARFKWSSTSL